MRHPDNAFKTPSDLIASHAPVSDLDIHNFVSWADVERDLSAWMGNNIQKSALKHVYELEKRVKGANNNKLLEDWRRLQTSDHFYYMCTKWFSDGDVHKYFNPYESPYDAFISYMNVLSDFKIRLSEKREKDKFEARNPKYETNSKITN